MTLCPNTLKYDASVIPNIEQSTDEKESESICMQNELLNAINEDISMLKNKIIDEDLNDLKQWNILVKNDLNGYCDSFSRLHDDTRYLQQQLSRFESIKKSLERALVVATNRRQLCNCESKLRTSLMNMDLESCVLCIVEAHRVYQEDGWMSESDQRIVDGIKLLERELSKQLNDKLKRSIAESDFQCVEHYSSLLCSFNTEREALEIYLDALRTQLAPAREFNEERTNSSEGDITFNIQKSSCSNQLAQVFDIIMRYIRNQRNIVEKVFGVKGFLYFLQGVEKETDLYSIQILEYFQKDNQCLLDSTTETLSFEFLKETDILLEELALISCKCQIFIRFLHHLGRDALASVEASPDNDKFLQNERDKFSPIHGMATLSAMTRKLQELMGFYVSLEHAYAFVSLKKAFEEALIVLHDSDCFGSTFPDDAFFVLRKVILRSIGSRDDFAVCAVINFLSGLLSSLTKTFLVNFLESSAPFYFNWLTLQFGPGTSNSGHRSKSFYCALSALVNKPDRLPELSSMLKWTSSSSPSPSLVLNKQKKTDSQCSVKLSWPHLFTDLSLCEKYIDNLVHLSQSDFTQSRHLSGFNGSERQTIMFQQSVLGLGAAKKEFQTTLQYFTAMFVETLLKILDSSFREFLLVSFAIDDVVFADYQVNDPFASGFISQLEQVMSHIKSLYTSHCVNIVIDTLVDQITLKLEECIFQKKFTLLGGIQLETDIRAILGYFNEFFDRPFLSKFSRLMDIVELLCTSSIEELQHVLDPFAIEKSWKLSLQEMQKLMERRVDFPQTELLDVFSRVASFYTK